MTSTSRKVLVIDDEDDIRDVTVMSLALTADWSVIGAKSGEEGIAEAKREKPDAIILDVMMPGLDGPQTLDLLRKDAATEHIPVIFLTAKAQPSDTRKFQTMGVAAVLTKPFDPMALSGKISELLGWS